MSELGINSVDMNNGQVRLYHGDSRDVLRELADNSIDSIVTDPPYALVSIQKRFGKPGSAPAQHGTDGAFARAARGFMGKDWDVGDTAFADAFWAECLRVLKPGGHVLAFGGTRTYHRLVCAIEDAGFEIRDQIGWAYGSGFPKSHNQHGDWEGWGTALKPAWEPIVVARKAIDGTVAGNLEAWGVGALNIDGCRVGTEGGTAKGSVPKGGGNGIYGAGLHGACEITQLDAGRWPANIIHDGSDEVLAAFPETGVNGTPKEATRTEGSVWNIGGERSSVPGGATYNDQGSAARFFYCAKASRADRDEGLDHLPVRRTGGMSATADGAMLTGAGNERTTTRANIHPTVKPTSLMQYLCRLVTPPGGTVLDPFLGSGSTGKAAVLEGFRFVGVEREDEYFPIAEARIQWALDEVSKPKAKQKAKVRKQPAAPANDNTVADLFSHMGATDAA